MSCCALTTNLKDCRNWSCLDSPYCHAHKGLSQETLKDRWLTRYIIGRRRIPQYTIISPFNQEKILSDLRSGVICLTPQDIRKIPVTEGYVDVYLLLLENKFAKHGDHPKLERMGLWLYQVIMCNFPFDDRDDFQRNKLTILKRKLETHLITQSGKSLYDFFFFIGAAAVGRRRFQRQLLNYVPTLLDTDAAKELSWYSHDELDKIRKEWEECVKVPQGMSKLEHPLMRPLVERWLPDLKELYQTEKAIQKVKMDQCKEELMMDRWHPDRLQKYLDMGFDIDQLDDIM